MQRHLTSGCNTRCKGMSTYNDTLGTPELMLFWGLCCLSVSINAVRPHVPQMASSLGEDLRLASSAAEASTSALRSDMEALAATKADKVRAREGQPERVGALQAAAQQRCSACCCPECGGPLSGRCTCGYRV